MLGSKAKGFTLIEALVAITILLLGVLGPLSVATRGITDGLIAKDKITALQLAQEGIELVRTKVASNFRAGQNSPTSWLNDSDLNSCVPGPCSVEPKNNVYSVCAPLPSTSCSIRYRSSDGIYVKYDSADSAQSGVIFNRTIQITKPAIVFPMITDPALGDPEVKVTVVVGWQDKTQFRSVTLNNYIYNPYDKL